MSRDTRGNGVQVVAGSNPACPTKLNPNRKNDLAALRARESERSESNFASSSRLFKQFGSRFLNDLHRF